MRKKILSLSILFSLILATSCSNDLNNETSTNQVDKSSQRLEEDDDDGGSGNATTVWTIGRKSRDCFSIGICKLKKVKVKVLTVEATVYGNRMFAANIKPIDSNNFILQVDEENMLDIVKEFGGKYLILEEDFTIDSEETVNLNLTENFTIKSGQYNFVKNNTNSLYELQLSN